MRVPMDFCIYREPVVLHNGVHLLKLPRLVKQVFIRSWFSGYFSIHSRPVTIKQCLQHMGDVKNLAHFYMTYITPSVSISKYTIDNIVGMGMFHAHVNGNILLWFKRMCKYEKFVCSKKHKSMWFM